MTGFLVVVAVLAVLAVLAALALAAKGRRRYADANQVVPGVATGAPAEWAGAHTPEARLHRRLRDAVAALRRNPGLDHAGVPELRASVEQAALEADRRLIAAAALPERVRDDPLAHVTRAVEVIEETVAAIAAWPAAGEDALADAVARAAERVSLVAGARAELDAAYPTTAVPAEAPEPAPDPGRRDPP